MFRIAIIAPAGMFVIVIIGSLVFTDRIAREPDRGGIEDAERDRSAVPEWPTSVRDLRRDAIRIQDDPTRDRDDAARLPAPNPLGGESNAFPPSTPPARDDTNEDPTRAPVPPRR